MMDQRAWLSRAIEDGLDTPNINTEAMPAPHHHRRVTKPRRAARADYAGALDHGGELFFHIVAAFAQIQRRQISEKTRAGLAAAKARGRLGGRPTVMGPDRVELARRMRAEGKSYDDIAALLKVGASSVKRALRDRSVVPEPDAGRS